MPYSRITFIWKVTIFADGGKKKILLLRSPEVLKSPVVQSAISTTSTPTTSGDSANQEPVRKSQRLKEAKNAPKKSPPPQGYLFHLIVSSIAYYS